MQPLRRREKGVSKLLSERIGMKDELYFVFGSGSMAGWKKKGCIRLDFPIFLSSFFGISDLLPSVFSRHGTVSGEFLVLWAF